MVSGTWTDQSENGEWSVVHGQTSQRIVSGQWYMDRPVRERRMVSGTWTDQSEDSEWSVVQGQTSHRMASCQ